MRGRLPKSTDPHQILADAAGRLTRGRDSCGLEPVLREQVAWMVTDRVGLARQASSPEFDPTGLKPRQRWESLQSVLDGFQTEALAVGNVHQIRFNMLSIVNPDNGGPFPLAGGGLNEIRVIGVNAIPEPATALMGVLGLAGLAIRRRRVA